MSKKIEDGTVLSCNYLHLNSAEFIRKFSEIDKFGRSSEYKEWKVESKLRPALILFETDEKFPYRSYCLLKFTTQEETAKRNKYFCVEKILGNGKISYVRPYPETYPDNLLEQKSKPYVVNPLLLSAITERMSLSKIGLPLN